MKLLRAINAQLAADDIDLRVRIVYGLERHPNDGFIALEREGHEAVAAIPLEEDADDLHAAVAAALSRLARALHPFDSLDDELSTLLSSAREEVAERDSEIAKLHRECADYLADGRKWLLEAERLDKEHAELLRATEEIRQNNADLRQALKDSEQRRENVESAQLASSTLIGSLVNDIAASDFSAVADPAARSGLECWQQRAREAAGWRKMLATDTPGEVPFRLLSDPPPGWQIPSAARVLENGE